jgi:HlyD family secretion protein
MRGILRIIIVVGLVAALSAGGYYVWHGRHPAKSLLRTAAVRKGDLEASITATGTVEPVERVDVGAQVAGQLVKFGNGLDGKPIDYGSEVEAGGLLAEIDTNLYSADVQLATAQRDSDKAGVLRAEADLEQMRAKETQAEADWNRAQKLGPSEALAPTTYDSYKANYAIAKANVDLDVAAVEQAKAAIKQSEATLFKAKQQLDYCIINSPVKGTIIDRRVNLGETVVSSFNTPSLFLIAADLTHIQVWASVNEADIGQIHPGQPVTFTVDAYPTRTFHGNVNKIRLNATMTQNVVTYTVEVNAENKDGKLLPYLTANVKFLTGEATNAVLALNSALRFHPASDLIAPAFRPPEKSADDTADATPVPSPAGAPSEQGQGASTNGGPEKVGGSPAAAGGRRGRGRRSGSGDSSDEMAVEQFGTLWAKEGAYVRPIAVKLGLTDGTWTEVTGEGVKPGLVVVTGVVSTEMPADASAAGSNPFLPQFGRRGGPGGGGGFGGGGGGGGRRGP